jgi:hypothetical protein
LANGLGASIAQLKSGLKQKCHEKHFIHPLPQSPQIPVGAGLPAMRAALPTLMLPDTPPSLASQLPQGLRVWLNQSLK